MAKIFGIPISIGVVNPNLAAFTVETAQIAVINTPVQLPNIPIPDGVEVTIRSALTNAFSTLIFVANSSLNALDPLKRVQLRPGTGVELKINNTNLVWISSAVVGAKVEIIFES